MMLTTRNAIQRKIRTTKCGIASSHLTSQSQRESGSSSSPVTTTGCGRSTATSMFIRSSSLPRAVAARLAALGVAPMARRQHWPECGRGRCDAAETDLVADVYVHELARLLGTHPEVDDD